MSFAYNTLYQSSECQARVGEIFTPHGRIETPVLAPVGTQASVKALTPEQLKTTGAQIILANTYHLYLRPGSQRIANAGGIHRFMSLDLPIMTDSGGFQVFSLGSSIRDGVGKIASIFPDEEEGHKRDSREQPKGESMVKIEESGVTFKSHLDGSKHHLSPESSLQIQSQIGADFVLAFDECTSPLDSYEYTRNSLERTHRWGERSAKAFEQYCDPNRQALFGIVQGGFWEDLRLHSTQFLNNLPCFGFSIGGSLGKTKDDMLKILDWTLPNLRQNAPRHLLGIGEVADLLEGIQRGVDLFDCVIPTRWARTASAILSPQTYSELFDSSTAEPTRRQQESLRINLRNARWQDDPSPLDPTCSCYTCTHFSRMYLSHLYRAGEMLAYTLVTIHNIAHLVGLIARIRDAIREDRFMKFKQAYLAFGS